MRQLILIGLLVLSSTSLMGQTLSADETSTELDIAKDVAEAAVEANALAIDTNNDEMISRPEQMAAAVIAFPVYDADNSGYIDVAEFKESPFGFADMARQRGRSQAYDAAFGVAFDLFDHAGDGRVSNEEFLNAVDRAFSFADFDSNNVLSREEYTRGFFINVALRHAMSD